MKPTELVYDLSECTDEQISTFQTAVTDTLDQLGLDYDFDEIGPDSIYKIVGLKPTE